MAVQSQSYEPWALKPIADRREAVLRDAAAMARHLRQVLRILVLLRQHVPHNEMKLFVHALGHASPSDLFFEDDAHDPPARWSLRSRRWRPRKPAAPRKASCEVAFAKAFPSLWWSLPGLLNEVKPTFKGVELIVLPREDASSAMCLGPHCQCAFRFGLDRRRRSRQARAPWLVGSVAAVRERAQASPGLPPVRFTWWRPGEQLGAGENTFRTSIRTIRVACGGSGRLSRCQVGALLPQAFLAVDGALDAIHSFICDIQKEGERMYGSEGNPHLQLIRSPSIPVIRPKIIVPGYRLTFLLLHKCCAPPMLRMGAM